MYLDPSLSPSATMKGKATCRDIKKPTPSHKLRAEDIATREMDQYIHSPCPEVDTNPLEWWKTHYVYYNHLVCLAKNIYVFLLRV